MIKNEKPAGIILNCWWTGNQISSTSNEIFWYGCRDVNANLRHVSAGLVGGILESMTRLWLKQRATVHPLNAPSATAVGPKAPSCQSISTHAWWWVTLKAKGPVAPLQPLSGRLDKVNLWAHTTDTWISVCIFCGKQRGFSTWQQLGLLQCECWNVSASDLGFIHRYEFSQV